MSPVDEKGFNTFPRKITRPEPVGGLDVTLLMTHEIMVQSIPDLTSSGNSMKTVESFLL